MATSDSIEKETTFTQGPWHVGTPHPQNACAYVIGAKGDEIAVLYGADQAEKNADGMWGPQPRREATAALIAAAPELYEALAEIELQWLPYSDADLERFARMHPDDGGVVQPHWAEKILAARRALRKAREEDRSHEGK